MERSPRSAAVCPGAGASMGHYHTLRSFVISLAIAIALTNSPASGFTIPRLQNILDSTTDLETGESTQLEVRYDLKALNESNIFNNNKTKGDSDSTVIAINDPKKADSKNSSNEKDNEIQLNINETIHTQSNVTVDSTIEKTTNLSKTSSTGTARHSITTSAPSTSQTTTRETERNPDLTTQSTRLTSLIIESQIKDVKEYSNEATKKDIVENEIKVNKTQNGSDATGAHRNEHNASKSLNNNDADKSGNKINDINNLNESVDHFTERKDTRSIFEYESKVNNDTDVADQKADQTRTKEGSSISKTNGSLDAPTTSSEFKTDVTTVMFDAPTTATTAENITTETVNTDFYPPTLPSWKKYTTIDRKRTSTEDTTALDKDMARAETSQTRISLENVFSNTPIPSLEKLRNDLINAQESTTIRVAATNATEMNVTTVSFNRTSTPNVDSKITNETMKLEIVSKRAGYKDNRVTTTPMPVEATTSEFPPKVSANNTEMFSSMYETEPSEVEVSDNKNDTVYESQSQLAEDAIKEELLKEETLNDNEENAMRHHDERIILPRVKQLKQGMNSDEYVTEREIVTEDMLSVKPIGHEKKKNSILYAVSPNYKPLKKIDVQPQKQFIRDPDDNSWRNESISSLGIVFKPKNASKSFTQVLKNKTETELGNMTDKDNKGDVPDLRLRLEKIAEVRKSKKKINKFGDTVYSDYEESGENANPSKEDTTSPMSPSGDLLPNFTPPPSSKSPTTEFDLTVNAISRDNFDLFKNDGTTPLTTNKPKKFYNLAEYYDSTDEYDADYVNLHKIDLKKFTQPLKPKDNPATQPPQVLYTKPMREYQPERKATLQYFPPTQKIPQKVNLNDYDTDFNRKVNLYTYKAPPKNILAASFGTVSPIQTEKYEQPNKVTTKPAYTPMYQSNNLDKNLYLTNQPRVSEPPSGFVPNDGNFNRASYVIKHYRDFINEAAKEGEDDRSGEYLYTESPLRGVTINELAKMTTPRDGNPGEEDYDYDVKFRKDIINRFVDNFNQNSDRFKVDFPILYNSSVVHRQTPEHGRVASSTAFMKRLYDAGHPRPANFPPNKKPCDPHCDNMTVELSPAYELHYYVPDQEEKEEIEQRPITVPYRYRL